MCEHILKKNTALQYNSNSLNCKKDRAPIQSNSWIVKGQSTNTIQFLDCKKRETHSAGIRLHLKLNMILGSSCPKTAKMPNQFEGEKINFHCF